MTNRLRALAATIALMVTAATADAAARIEPLHPQQGAACTRDRAWCVANAGGQLNVSRAGRRVAAVPMSVSDRGQSDPWASIIRVALPGRPEFALVGVLHTEREMYSGGGASVARLALFEVHANGEPARMVFTAPWSSSVMIRACFTPADERRRGACHDEYRYSATLVAPPQPAGAVRLVYRSRADSFPGRRKRYEDSARERPLRKQDLYRAIDRACTVERTLLRNPATGAFTFNAPLPPCSDYLELQ